MLSGLWGRDDAQGVGQFLKLHGQMPDDFAIELHERCII
jgi:hypothetical protein